MIIAKNMAIVILNIVSWFKLLEFPLTPRSSSLANLLAIGIPSYFISLKNKNVLPVPNFLKESIGSGLFSGAIIAVFMLIACYLGQDTFFFSKDVLQQSLTTLLIIILLINYSSSVIFEDTKNLASHIIFDCILILLYVLFLSIPGAQIIKIAASFYEISFYPPDLWMKSLLLLIPAGSILLIMSYLMSREKRRSISVRI